MLISPTWAWYFPDRLWKACQVPCAWRFGPLFFLPSGGEWEQTHLWMWCNFLKSTGEARAGILGRIQRCSPVVGLWWGRPRWDGSWTWQGMQRVTRRDSKGMSAQKRKVKESVPLLISKAGKLLTVDEGKAELLTLHWQPLFPHFSSRRTQDGDQGSKVPPTVG